MTEENSDANHPLQPFVFEKQDVVVERDCFHVGKTLLHPLKRALDIADRHGKNLFEQCLAEPSVDEDEQKPLSALPGDNEISLHVSDAFSFVDMLGSFGDHAFAVELRFRHSPAPRPFEYLRAMRFDSPAVYAPHVPFDRSRRDIREDAFNAAQPSGNRFGRLIVHEGRLNERSQRWIKGNLFAHLAHAPHADIRKILRVPGIVYATRSLLLQLIPNDTLPAFQRARDGREGIPPLSKNL